jgi:hypothetical protein
MSYSLSSSTSDPSLSFIFPTSRTEVLQSSFWHRLAPLPLAHRALLLAPPMLLLPILHPCSSFPTPLDPSPTSLELRLRHPPPVLLLHGVTRTPPPAPLKLHLPRSALPRAPPPVDSEIPSDLGSPEPSLAERAVGLLVDSCMRGRRGGHGSTDRGPQLDDSEAVSLVIDDERREEDSEMNCEPTRIGSVYPSPV